MSRKKNNNNREQQQSKRRLVFTNILGEKEEPVCDNLSCYHKFSIHGHRSHIAEFNCVCKSPHNAAIGIVIK
jgi:hypothetical protein